MPSISIEVPQEDRASVTEALRDAGIPVTEPTGHGFDGGQAMDLIVSLTPHAATFLAGLYAERLRANRYISLKMKGLEVKGVSEAALLKLAGVRNDPPAKS